MKKSLLLASATLAAAGMSTVFAQSVLTQSGLSNNPMSKSGLPGVSTKPALSTPATPDQLLQGDAKLACEAVLCLSSGQRPDECTPSLQRYFSIRLSKPWKTIDARRNFLKMCPASNENDQMRSLVNAMANGAGSCDENSLNRITMPKQVTKCVPNPNYDPMQARLGFYDEPKQICRTETIMVVNPALPGYCQAYYQHEFIQPGDLKAPTYVGKPEEGGHWVK